MDLADWERAAAIYVPLVAAIVARLLWGRRPRQFAACLLSVLWTLPSLLVLQRINEYAGWWSFARGSAVTLRHMPLELFIGWVLLWGLIPPLALPRWNVLWSVVGMVALDCLLMPMCRAVLELHSHWLVGEAVGATLVLIPALCLAQWTRNDTHLGMRAAMQVATAGTLFLFLIPEMIFAAHLSLGWMPLLALPGWQRQIALQAVFFLALPGVGAVLEFVQRGGGTPIPYDPPRRLVASGIYRYCANPMQLSCALVMLAWAGLLRSGWMVLAAVVSVIYSAGLAEWDESEDLEDRFGQPWKDYRAAVRSWRFRGTPYHAGPPALLYVARGCGPCSEVRLWLEARKPKGLQIADAESLPAWSIQRIRYDPQDGSVPLGGVRAMGRALEHLHLGWALCGTALRLPGVWQFIQLCMDASGLGPREIQAAVGCSMDKAQANYIAPLP